MMSSLMPSEKYSCSGSPLMLANGRTQMGFLFRAPRRDVRRRLAHRFRPAGRVRPGPVPGTPARRHPLSSRRDRWCGWLEGRSAAGRCRIAPAPARRGRPPRAPRRAPSERRRMLASTPRSPPGPCPAPRRSGDRIPGRRQSRDPTTPTSPRLRGRPPAAPPARGRPWRKRRTDRPCAVVLESPKAIRRRLLAFAIAQCQPLAIPSREPRARPRPRPAGLGTVELGCLTGAPRIALNGPERGFAR